ncbi:MAG TPA: cupin domain-containing protein [Magnetospirillum sp.]|jgi:hypothetical protein|nr:cupin domain-containing protein [Magnetospirillum sp.]
MRILAGALLLSLSLAGAAAADTEHPQVQTPDRLIWQQGPPGLPPGAQFAVLRGNPDARGGEFVLRLKVPAGYHIAAHHHGTPENLTIISGSMLYASGPHPDRASAVTLPEGSYVYLPANGTHEVWAGDQGAVVEMHSTGPFQITYTNQADDPRKQQAASPY